MLDTYVVLIVATYVVEIFMTYVVKYCYKCGIYYICGSQLLQMWGHDTYVVFVTYVAVTDVHDLVSSEFDYYASTPTTRTHCT